MHTVMAHRLPVSPESLRLGSPCCLPAFCPRAGITILDGDCHADVAANTTMKLLQVLGQSDIPVAVSSLTAANPFPAPYRSQGLILDVLPMLNHGDSSDLAALKDRQLQQQPGQEFFAQLLLQQTEKVTVVATGG